MKLRPADVAKECRVSVGTVRNWCSDYAAMLSPGANPSDGNRVLNERDLEICRYVSTLRKEGMSKPQIILRLRETSFGHIDAEEPTDNSIVGLQSLQESPQQPLESTALTVVPQDYLIALEHRFEAMEAAIKETKQTEHKLLRDAVFLVLAGAVGALVIVLIIVVLMGLLYGK